MNNADIKIFKKNVAECLQEQYGLDEITAYKAVSDSYMSQMLKVDKDFVTHDSVEEWAEHIYHEVTSERSLQM